MSIFIDTGVFYAHHDIDAHRNDAAAQSMNDILDGEYGQPYTSDYVLDETITLTMQRTGSFDAADTVANRILGDDSRPQIVEIIFTDPDDIMNALNVFRQFSDHTLSFTDAVTVAVLESRGIDGVLSFDGGFDGVIQRIEPMN